MHSISSALHWATGNTEQEASNVVFFCGHLFSLSSERLGKSVVSSHPHLLEHMSCRLSEQVAMFLLWIRFLTFLLHLSAEEILMQAQSNNVIWEALLSLPVVWYCCILWVYVFLNRMYYFWCELYSLVRKSGDFWVFFIYLDNFKGLHTTPITKITALCVLDRYIWSVVLYF